MMMKIKRWSNRKGQNTAEYAILFALVIAAFVTIQVYAKRSLQARVKTGADALTSIGTTFNGPGPETATFGNNLTQYEPYYLQSFANTYQESVEQEHMGGGKIQKEKISDINVRGAGAYQAQLGAKNRAAIENALWQ